ncbi:MAG: hypothetical protein H6920_08945 [Sphingomonadaceae bacterium]|nr:hypothetical protein [Sphingomonadaceae bacterium]MCP5391732.1 hypothetical protein [Sphingomonadaceae bacterium]MCP5393846.1 hypothetical protein [Sphingomonadaceae bacterium]
MIVHSDIEKLRGDPAPQREAQAALERARRAWREAAGARLLAELESYGNGADLSDCPALGDLIAGRTAPVEAMLSSLLGVLVDHPLGHVPLRHHLTKGIGLLQLAEVGRAALTLVVHEPNARRAAPQSVSFTDAERHELVLAGEARVRLFDWCGQGDTPPTVGEQILRRGTKLAFGGFGGAKLVDEVAQTLVILRLSRVAVQPKPGVEIRAGDGAILHRAAGDRDESCREMAMALLTAMERTDAAPHLARLARSGTPESRWQALRHCLALDTATGFRELCAVADDRDDPLAPFANSLRSQLLAAHPALQGKEKVPCRA